MMKWTISFFNAYFVRETGGVCIPRLPQDGKQRVKLEMVVARIVFYPDREQNLHRAGDGIVSERE